MLITITILDDADNEQDMFDVDEHDIEQIQAELPQGWYIK